MDTFACYSSIASKSGTLYITTNNLCFDPIFFIKKRFTIQYSKITSANKEKSYIKISTQNLTTYTFSRFFLKGRDNAFKLLIDTAKNTGVILDGSVKSLVSGSQASLLSAAASDAKLNQKYHRINELFNLKNQSFTHKYGCVYKGPNHPLGVIGHIYISSECIAFYSKITSLKKVLNFNEIKTMDKARSALFFPNAIKIVSNDGATHTFDSFWKRDETYDILNKNLTSSKFL